MRTFNKRYSLSLAGGLVTLAISFGLTSCDENDGPNAGNNNTNDAKVNIINDPAQLAQYVTNYKQASASKSIKRVRSRAEEAFEMPALPTSFDGMTKVEGNPWWPGYSFDGNTNFYVAAGDVLDFTGGLQANNKCNIYIFGKIKTNLFAPAQGANIYIAPGGELELTGADWDKNPGVLKNDTPTNLYIYNGGKYVGSYTSASKTGLYVEGDLTAGDVEFGGAVEITGTLYADKLTTNNSKFHADAVIADAWTYNNDSRVFVDHDIDVEGNVTINAQNVAIECQNYLVGGNFHMENNSELYAYEHIGVQGECEISTQGLVYTPCLYVKEKLYVKNCATINVPNYIGCKSFEASASGFNIVMGGDALFNAGECFTIQNKDWTIRFDNTEDSQSAIVAKKFEIMEGQAAYISGYAYLSAAEYWGKPSENFRYYWDSESEYATYNVQETVKVTIDGVTVKSAPDDCKPEFETKVEVPEPPTITELISTISHTHDISATCVAINNGKAYLSWHKRGTSIHGCLEALQVVDDIASLTSWMEVDDNTVEGGDNVGGNSAVSGADENGESQGQYDFNHLIVVDNQIVTVGDNMKMGGFIGTIGLDGAGDFGTNGTVQDAFKARQLLGKVTEKVARSGNTVVYNNGKYYIACAGGFQEYDGDLNAIFTKENGKWAASLGEYELTLGSAKHIAINPAGDKVATLEFTSRAAVADGDDYWFNDTETAIEAVLKVRNAGNWLGSSEWEVNIGEISPIYGKNSIAMDATGNVYVSAGKKGLLVYNNGTKVGEFSISDQYPRAGVNGVAIDDRYVYVAYGISGLWILNKSDLSVVSWYKSNAPEGYETQSAAASANYVALDGEYIYVAYGRHGVKVLKLND